MGETTLISVRVPSAIAKRLAMLAESTERSTFYVAAEAIEAFVTLQEWQVEVIRQGLAEADEGKLIPHEEALARLSRWKRGGAS